jgi:transposase
MKKIPRVAYTLEFKVEALRRVRSGEAVRAVAREIGVPDQTIRNWFKAQAEGKLGSAANGKPITPEQMEISRLRAENGCSA